MSDAIPGEEYILKGTSACGGCTAQTALRFTLKAAGSRTILLVGAGCLVVVEGIFPNTSYSIPTLDTSFASVASMASGVVAALDDDDINVIAFSGDGGTFDIGLQGLSGAIERGTNFLYICYDNEAYGNTGIQRSSATPFGASTTTTPHIKREHKKDIAGIIAAHEIPYVATANSAYPKDLYEKVKKALSIKGPKFIHILTPCPTGWRFPSGEGVEIGKLAVKTGIWVLYEIEDKRFRLSKPSLKVIEGDAIPVIEYLKIQGRFSNMSEEEVKILQQSVDRKLEDLRRRVENGA
ncbi:MAG: thiamine pyrophosphate-dependent enzyme [Halobacteriota archaeon]|nr:thiamine pyrophosphate-dependent enzyme [Halobacteriota archaeon]